MVEATLSESGEWAGFWWIASEPDAKHPGVLHFDPARGLELRLIGGWEYEAELPHAPGVTTGQLKDWPMVHGRMADGTPVTLLHLFVSAVKRTHSRYKASEAPDHLHLHADIALVGHHLQHPAAPEFVAVSATVENLTVWSSRSGIHHSRHRDGPYSRGVQLGRLGVIEAETEALTVTLDHWDVVTRQSTRSRSSALVEEWDAIRFRSTTPQPLSSWLDLVAGVADLMSLSMLRASAVIGIRLLLPTAPGDPAHHRERPEVQLLQHRVTQARPDEASELHHHALMTLDDVDFATLMPRWLAVRERFAAARGMVLGLQYVPDGYLENRVVTAVAAAESMHRSLDPAPPIPAEDFRRLRKTLLDQVAPDYKQWLAERLTSHANVPSLRERLVDLATRIGEPGSALVGDVERWASAAKNARNQIAHLGSAQEEVLRMHALVEVTSGVVVLNLLHELGMTEDQLMRSVTRHPKLSFAASLARSHFANARPSPHTN